MKKILSVLVAVVIFVFASSLTVDAYPDLPEVIGPPGDLETLHFKPNFGIGTTARMVYAEQIDDFIAVEVDGKYWRIDYWQLLDDNGTVYPKEMLSALVRAQYYYIECIDLTPTYIINWTFSQNYIEYAVDELIRSSYDSGYDQAIQDNYQDVYRRAFELGREEGFSAGVQHGIEITQPSAYRDGYNDGYAEGENYGYNQGLKDSQIQGLIELYEVNNELYDEIDLENMTLIKRVNQIIFNGVELWTWFPAQENTTTVLFRAEPQLLGSDVNINDTNTAVSTWLPQKNVYGIEINTEGFFVSNQDQVFVRVFKSRIDGWNDSFTQTEKQTLFRNYLGIKPLTVDYKIHEEIIQITQIDLEMQPVWRKAFADGYRDGYTQGKTKGFQEGEESGYDKALEMAWLRGIFVSFSAFFAITLFGEITIGMIVGVPLFIALAFWVFKLLRGGN